MNERNNELQAITDTINLYIDGIHTGNIETLRQAFHPKAMMYSISSKTVTTVEIEGLYDFVSSNKPPSKTGEPNQSFITCIQNTGNAASVEMIEESAYGHNYTNYFHLLKIDGKWLIVSKAYNTTATISS